jgi:hypothetical protein
MLAQRKRPLNKDGQQSTVKSQRPKVKGQKCFFDLTNIAYFCFLYKAYGGFNTGVSAKIKNNSTFF